MATISYVRCETCGSYEDEDGGRFCPHCGAERSAPTRQLEAPPEPVGQAGSVEQANSAPLAQPPAAPTLAQGHLPPPGYRPAAAPAGSSRPNRDRAWLIGLGVAALLVLAAIGAGLYIGGVFSSSGGSQTAIPASKITPAASAPSTAAPQDAFCRDEKPRLWDDNAFAGRLDAFLTPNRPGVCDTDPPRGHQLGPIPGRLPALDRQLSIRESIVAQ